MDPRKWGPAGWEFIHSVALGYPNSPSLADKDRYRTFFVSIGGVLPCPVCRGHYTEFFEQTRVLFEHSLDSPTLLFEWTVDAHNNVNRHNGKSEWSYEQAINRYHSIYVRSKPKSDRTSASASAEASVEIAFDAETDASVETAFDVETGAETGTIKTAKTGGDPVCRYRQMITDRGGFCFIMLCFLLIYLLYSVTVRPRRRIVVSRNR